MVVRARLTGNTPVIRGCACLQTTYTARTRTCTLVDLSSGHRTSTAVGRGTGSVAAQGLFLQARRVFILDLGSKQSAKPHRQTFQVESERKSGQRAAYLTLLETDQTSWNGSQLGVEMLPNLFAPCA